MENLNELAADALQDGIVTDLENFYNDIDGYNYVTIKLILMGKNGEKYEKSVQI